MLLHFRNKDETAAAFFKFNSPETKLNLRHVFTADQVSEYKQKNTIALNRRKKTIFAAV
jgi:hypothetical protein